LNRRDFVITGAMAAVGSAVGLRGAPPRPRPSKAQLAWQRDEIAIFFHFGVNTFTNREWGDGKEDPAIFDPPRLDPAQWAAAARAGGARAAILTAKHHDGFCLWPTKTTTHSVAKSPWRGGRGDVVREFVNACRAEHLRPGLYLSPWDRNSPLYGDSPRYNDLYCDQLTELLTHYGPIAEVWFDGANGEGPNGKKQVYDWPRVWALVRKLQPEAIMFSDAGPDVRWCGNEKGSGGDPNWSTVNPEAVKFPGASGPGVISALQHGDPEGAVWRPAEADTSIRPGWFHHPAEDGRVRTEEQLVDLYSQSVGRNAKLLLNVPPTRDGVLHDVDVRALTRFSEQLTLVFLEDAAAGRRVAWRRTGEKTATADIELAKPTQVAIVRIEENITHGQSIARHVVSGSDGGEWRELAAGTTVGYTRLHRFEPQTVRRVRVTIDDAVAPPEPIVVKVYRGVERGASGPAGFGSERPFQQVLP
jgi:alpha-L-fucosidase